MAASHLRPPAHCAATRSYTAAPGQLTLRTSCHGCASSKLKCSQEKPTCSRCAKRGVTCEYVAAKRGGRKPKNRLSDGESSHDMSARQTAPMDMNTNMQTSSSPSDWFALTALTQTTGRLSSPGVTQYTPCQNVRRSSDILHDLFSPRCENPSATSNDTGAGLDELFTTPTFSTEISDVNFFETADFFSSTINSSSTGGSKTLIDSLSASEDARSELPFLSGHSSLLSHATSFGEETHDVHEGGRSAALEPSCSCLVQALGLMKQLSAPITSDTCSTWSSQGLDKTTVIPSIQAVIAQNKATIESLSTMLRCSCSEDGYLLTITSLIVFKVLSWYAIIARKASSLQNSSFSFDGCSNQPSPPWEQQQQKVLPSPTVVGQYCLEGTDSARMAAQLILNELHCVRRLVDQLSAKLKLQGLKNERVSGGAIDTTSERIGLQQEMTLPLSTTMYNQLDVDLRKQIRTLSSEMIDRLRRL